MFKFTDSELGLPACCSIGKGEKKNKSSICPGWNHSRTRKYSDRATENRKKKEKERKKGHYYSKRSIAQEMAGKKKSLGD